MSEIKPKLTDEQKAKYMATGGRVCCPWCESTHVVSADVQPTGGRLTTLARCHTCGRGWREEWTLTAVGEDE